MILLINGLRLYACQFYLKFNVMLLMKIQAFQAY